jgi:hypothetical protein
LARPDDVSLDQIFHFSVAQLRGCWVRHRGQRVELRGAGHRLDTVFLLDLLKLPALQ